MSEALNTGSRDPLWKDTGKELKPQFFPDQLATWLGLTLATEADAAGLLFPTVNPEAVPAILEDNRALTDDDVFNAKTEDRYPATAPENATALVQQLGRLPRRSLMLSHDTEANSALLAKTANELTAGTAPDEHRNATA